MSIKQSGELLPMSNKSFHVRRLLAEELAEMMLYCQYLRPYLINFTGKKLERREINSIARPMFEMVVNNLGNIYI